MQLYYIVMIDIFYPGTVSLLSRPRNFLRGESMPAGRPPKYTSADEIQELIDKYFIDCDGHTELDSDGNAICDKNGLPIIVGAKPPTVTGLALALGFNTRLALINYQGKREFANTITRAKTYIEEYAERRLFDRDGVNGAKFSLINNFKGWSDKSDINLGQDGAGFKISIDDSAKDWAE